MPRRADIRKPPTIETVARVAGVSAMTVSRVLRGTDKVASSTRERVESAMHELGYVHNRLAGALASSRSAQVAVIVPTLRNAVFTEVLAGVARGLDGSGFQPVVGIVEYDQDREYELLRSMMSWRPAGVIMTNIPHRKATSRILQSSDVPVVEVMGLGFQPVDISVGIDHGAVGKTMATHLIQLGYRRFACLGTDHNMDHASALRFKGFCEVLDRQGGALLAARTVRQVDALSLGRQQIEPLLQAAPEAQAVYCSNDAVAAGAMMYCLAKGIDVPGALGIAGFGGLEIASAMPVAVTTVKSPLFDIGRLAAERVLGRLQGETVPLVTNAEFTLVPGGSCRSLRG